MSDARASMMCARMSPMIVAARPESWAESPLSQPLTNHKVSASFAEDTKRLKKPPALTPSSAIVANPAKLKTKSSQACLRITDTSDPTTSAKATIETRAMIFRPILVPSQGCRFTILATRTHRVFRTFHKTLL